MFSAYSLSSIATKLPLGIESISSSGKTLYGGTKNGSLVSYSPSVDNASYSLYVCKNFLTKAVSQLKVITELQIVISLSDGVITVHDCSSVNYPTVSTLVKTKNVIYFAADILANASIKGLGQKRCLCMCAVVRRKLLFYYWHNRDWHEIPEMPETVYTENVKAAVWCSDGQLALAVRDEYFMLTVFGNVQKDLLPGNTRYLFTAGNKSSTPVIKCLNELNIIGFCRDEMMYFVTLEGRPAESLGYANIRWSQIPNSLEYDHPFLVALLNTSIEIRSVKPPQLIQMIELQKPQLISLGCRTCLHVVSNPSSNLVDLYCLDAGGILLKTNIEKLVKDKEYELACQLAENLDENKNDSMSKAERMYEIRNLYAFHLFSQRHFKEAMEIFGQINAEVLYVIGLFPNLLPDEVRKRVAYPGPLPTDFAKNDQVQGLQALSEYLSMVRTNIARQLDAYEKRKFKPPSVVNATEIDTGAIVDEKNAVQQRNLLQIVDTTLLKCYLQTNDMLVASLLRLPDNRCDVTECEKILYTNKKFSELFLLYERKEMHEDALKLLQSQYKTKDSPLKGLTRSIHYLQNLGNKHLTLTLQYASWIFRENPDEAFKIFTEDCDEVKSLDRKRVLDFLQKESPELVVPYLEHIVGVFGETNQEFKDALIRHCFLEVQKHMDGYLKSLKGHSLAVAGQEPGDFGVMRSKLLKYIELSSRMNAEALLNELPDNMMHEERAILLGKTGRHYEAIAVYTNVLHDFKKAESYCLAHSRQVGKDGELSPQNLFLHMLSSYAKPEDIKIGQWTLNKPAPNVRMAMKVLQDYALFMNVPQALELLPLDIKFEELWIALESVLHSTVRKRSDAQIRRSLLYSLLLLTKTAKLKAQNVKLAIDYNVDCVICNKRIGVSAFAYLKNGTIVHYYCLPSKGT